jgi:hypothetical protein
VTSSAFRDSPNGWGVFAGVTGNIDGRNTSTDYVHLDQLNHDMISVTSGIIVVPEADKSWLKA